MIQLCLVLFVLNEIILGDQLIGTQILTRHGERTPSYSYGNQQYDLSIWRNGLGQLTVRGQFQQWSLGNYLRERYSKLINSTYVASEIYVRSTDYDRTLMSAYSNLVGLYPSSEYSLPFNDQHFHFNDWPKSIPWQPIPVHTISRSQDHLLGVSSCDKYEQLVDQMRKSPRIRQFNIEFRDLFDYLEMNTNQTIEDIFIAWDIADSILIEKLYNLTPTWINSNIVEQLRQLEDLCFYHLFLTNEINRLRGGPFIYDFLQNIRNLIANNGRGRKMRLYFGHDVSISATLAFLGVNYIHQPDFASSLFFDLYQLDDGSYAIQIEYLNTTNSRTTKIIEISGCSSKRCSLDEFVDLYGHLLPVDMNRECQLNSVEQRRFPRIFYTSS